MITIVDVAISVGSPGAPPSPVSELSKACGAWWGWAAMALVMLAWTGFALTSRAAATSPLTALDVDAIRYVIPVVLLAPWWHRAWQEVREADTTACVLIAAGGGLPFLLLTLGGAALSSASHVTLVNLGAVPLFLALAGLATHNTRPSWRNRVGLVTMVAGLLVLAVGTSGGALGVPVLLCSSALWTLYTLGQHRARVRPTTAALLMSAPSAIPAALLAVPTTQIGNTTPLGLATFVLAQGVGSGIVSVACFAVAVHRLGPTTVGAVGALTPLLVTLASNIVLGEQMPPAGLVAVALVSTGSTIHVASRRQRQEHRSWQDIRTWQPGS